MDVEPLAGAGVHLEAGLLLPDSLSIRRFVYYMRFGFATTVGGADLHLIQRFHIFQGSHPNLTHIMMGRRCDGHPACKIPNLRA